MSVSQVIDSRERDLGGFSVRRILPFETRQMVGPFIFFDHLGPASFAPGTGIDVRPHPHIALATVTYLFDGSLLHRDSLGSVREIQPGDVNWMSAGNGIAHSERTPPAARAAGATVHGIQSWVALPDGQEDGDASFVHHPSSMLPKVRDSGIEASIIVGSALGHISPVATSWPTLYVHAQAKRGASLTLPDETEERAIYVAEGEVVMDGTALRTGQMAIADPGTHCVLHASTDARVMLLGGARFPTPRYLWWNFVASTKERIEEAKQRWERGEFKQVPGETEFIPLPRG